MEEALFPLKAGEIGVKRIESGKYDVVILNFANCDMVGHTGVYEAVLPGFCSKMRIRS